ncbi:MAG: hypothetical protein QNJ40_17940 [Xanthomonadales bacterium]|nr:hypothetical protein [Xanthomonadales bacterium]
MLRLILALVLCAAGSFSAMADEDPADRMARKMAEAAIPIPARSHRICRDSDGTEYVQCAGPCRTGDVMVAMNKGSHPQCAGAGCPAIHAMGWTDGNKNDFCNSHGYAGAIPYKACRKQGTYRMGGWCYDRRDYAWCWRKRRCRGDPSTLRN